jgi:hypothetical protein
MQAVTPQEPVELQAAQQVLADCEAEAKRLRGMTRREKDATNRLLLEEMAKSTELEGSLYFRQVEASALLAELKRVWALLGEYRSKGAWLGPPPVVNRTIVKDVVRDGTGRIESIIEHPADAAASS